MSPTLDEGSGWFISSDFQENRFDGFQGVIVLRGRGPRT